jgi:hypothetical protein
VQLIFNFHIVTAEAFGGAHVNWSSVPKIDSFSRWNAAKTNILTTITFDDFTTTEIYEY